MQQRDDMLNVFTGNSTSMGLKELKIQLVLIQAACVLALEGITRATAGQIAARATKDYGIEVLPSFTGLIFTNLNIKKLISHGKSRFVLEYEQLKEIREQAETRCEELINKLETVIKTFHQSFSDSLLHLGYLHVCGSTLLLICSPEWPSPPDR